MIGFVGMKCPETQGKLYLLFTLHMYSIVFIQHLLSLNKNIVCQQIIFSKILILNKIDNIHIIGMAIRPFLESDSYKNPLKKRISPWVTDSWNFSGLRNIFKGIYKKKEFFFTFFVFSQ